MLPSWTITYDDGENEQTQSGAGKLSLDASWAFIIDTTMTPPTIVLAVPVHRIIKIEADFDLA